MLTSLAYIFLIGLAMAALCQQLHLPRIIGMLFTGILLGPFALNLLDDSILSISSELRQMALIIILIKAGLSLNLADLKKVGRPAVMMACVPASCEILAFFLLAPALMGVSRVEAAVMGAVLGAVSPAVVVPRMVQLMEEGYGTEKSIPQMILAGASCDDIFVIVLFSTFSSMAQGGSASLADFAGIPVSILLGVALGAAAGWLLSGFFETAYAHKHMVRNSMKVIVVLGAAFLPMAAETWLKGRVPLSGLLAVVAMKFLFPSALERCRSTLLELLGADTDFVEVFSAAGRAFSSGSDALTDAYTAVFGAAEVPASGSSVPRTDDLPGNVDMLQRVLNFDYADPVPAGDITSLFGARSDPLEGGGRFHYGLDIAGEEGTVISAFADGVVTAVGDSTDLGKYVTVTHEGGYSTLYAHCRRITASDGQQVRCGDPIAEMGDTGRATGVHLHFELHQDDVYLNPIYYVTFA